MNIALILLLNLAVGACIGLTGIAGFLLPMFYTGFLGMPPAESAEGRGGAASGMGRSVPSLRRPCRTGRIGAPR